MKVLLVQGYLGPMPENSLVYPIGLACIATALSADGHEVQIFDPNVGDDGLEKLGSELVARSPDLVGISLRNIDTSDYINYQYYYAWLSATIQAIRAVYPAVPLMIGGAGFSTFPDRIMRDHPDLAFGVFLEGEETAVDLLANLDRPAQVPGLYYRDGQNVRFTGPRPLPRFDDLSWPRPDFLDLAPYLRAERGIGIQSYRGCPMKCVYCNYPALNGRKPRLRSAQDVVDEIENLNRVHSVKDIVFVDSMFDLDRSYARRICTELIARRLDVRWKAYFETYDFNEEWFRLAQRAGCNGFFFSPDGATDRTMRALGKRCRERDLENVLRVAARHPEATFHVSVFCGVPKQDWRDVWRSLRLIFVTHFLRKNSRCFLNWIRVFPDTDIYRRTVGAGSGGRETDLLPASVSDHRPLFFIAPDSPRFATAITLAWFKVVDLLRRYRRHATTSLGLSR